MKNWFLILAFALGHEALAQESQNASVRATGTLTLFEGNSQSQNQVCTLFWEGDMDWNFQDFDACSNDEARSARLITASLGTRITLFDSPDQAKDDDYTVIKVLQDVTEPIDIDTFETSFENDFISVEYVRSNGLDGKVSAVSTIVFREEEKEEEEDVIGEEDSEQGTLVDES